MGWNIELLPSGRRSFLPEVGGLAGKVRLALLVRASFSSAFSELCARLGPGTDPEAALCGLVICAVMG